MNDWVRETVASGSLLLALPVALTAGLVSFFSPCVVPLLPGYLSYVSGVGVQDLDSGRRSRVVLGAALFVLGFSAVFVAGGALFGYAGRELVAYQRELSIATGILLVVVGLVFAGGLGLLQRDLRIHAVPAVGLGMAPALGVFFAVGWTPCIGPTLSAVLGLSVAADDATAARGALLAAVYCLGLGVPFLLAALGFARFSRSVRWFREHQRAISIAGGAVLVAVGLLLVTGIWDSLVTDLLNWVGGFETAL